MRNMEIAWVFTQLADLLELKGEDFFRIRAYRRAARAIAGLGEPVSELYASGRLKEIPGIGKNIIARTGELLTSGEMEIMKELQKKIPLGLIELMNLPGLGPKRVRLLNEHLGVTSLSELESAARAGKVRKVPGMGAKIEQEIVRSISRIKRKVNSLTLGAARELAMGLRDYLEHMANVQKVLITGQIRRWCKLVDTISLLVATGDAEEVVESFLVNPNLGKVLWRETGHVRVASRWGVKVELFAVPPDQFWFALLWSTGSEAHYARLQFLAWQRGWRLNRYGIFSRTGGNSPGIAGEEDIYKLLGMQYVVPELRENTGEIHAATGGKLPRLLETRQIRGDLHVHTNWSDGMCSIEEMALRARKKGYSYLAITDHSESLKIARGLTSDRLLQQHEKIRELNRQWDDFQLLTGIEVDILADGKLDCPDEVLASTDIVIASIHSGFRQSRDMLTGRLKSALAHDYVDIVGHPTGRLLGYREPYDVDIEDVIETAARYNKVLEINASPDRLDLDEYYARVAKERGVRVAINTDAHDSFGMDDIIFGVSVARRAWLEPEYVLNTLSIHELKKVLHR